jgi:uncharacterized membrane protein YuzA (DUF378 family)
MLIAPIDRAIIANTAFLLSGLAAMLTIMTFWKVLNASKNPETER